MAIWIDFKELRRSLSFEAVLRHYGVELKIKGKQHQGFCPLPTHAGEGRSPSFSANLEKGIFQCFGCGAKGNVLDFAVRMEGLDPENGEQLRKVALKLKGTFGPKTDAGAEPEKPKPTVAPPEAKPEPIEPEAHRNTIVNAPLDFELKGLDASHPYLASRGFKPETIAHFGLGYCPRGLMQGRIAIPLHDPSGRLIGYAGRLVDDGAVSESQPKYRLPSKREHQGVVHEFHKSAFLYNGYRVPWPADDLIVVEGFPAVWWLWQADYVHVVGLMGSSCSDVQAKLIIDSLGPEGRVWVFPDGDDAGARCAESLLVRLSPHRFTRWVKLDHGKQPTDCSPSDLGALLPIGGR